MTKKEFISQAVKMLRNELKYGLDDTGYYSEPEFVWDGCGTEFDCHDYSLVCTAHCNGKIDDGEVSNV